MSQNLNSAPTSAPKCIWPRGRIWRFAIILLPAALLAAGCARNRPATASVPPTPAPALSSNAPAESTSPLPAPFPAQPLVPGAYVDQGVASWYGFPFHGRRAANGEVFDMNQPVAAHRTLPFGSMVRVTNLTNGLSTEVRIIDRGPFVGNRIIDLSFAAATAINMVGPGTALVRLELLSSPLPLTGYFGVQIGAFQQKEKADELRAELISLFPVSVQPYDAPAGRLYRVRVGRETTPDAAQKLAVTLARQGGYMTFVVRLDDIH